MDLPPVSALKSGGVFLHSGAPHTKSFADPPNQEPGWHESCANAGFQPVEDLVE
jgi:hypothetical protein